MTSLEKYIQKLKELCIKQKDPAFIGDDMYGILSDELSDIWYKEMSEEDHASANQIVATDPDFGPEKL